jgi:hypothetical protein
VAPVAPAPAVPAAPADAAQALQIPDLPESPELPEVPGALQVPPPPPTTPSPPSIGDGQRSVSISRNNGRVRVTVEGRTNDYYLKLSANGHISLAPDGSGVTSIGNGDFLDATLTRNGQALRVRYSGDGGVRREFWVNGQSRLWGPQADDFEAELMPILFRETGINAEERVDWLLRQRGPDGLFAEIGLIDSDAVQTAYIYRWAETTTIAPQMLERVMDHASREIESDAHLQATLDKVFETQKPAGRTLVALLKAGESIDSDAHVTALLNTVGNAALDADETASAYYLLTRSIDSDAHMLAVLTPLVENASTSEARIGETLKLGAADIDSDAHLAALLEAAAPRVGNSDALARAYLEAASTIQSDAHNAAVLSKLAEKAQLSPQGWRDLLGAAARLRSDAHKAALLSSLAGRIRQPDLAAAWRAAVDTIDSDSHRRATERALP